MKTSRLYIIYNLSCSFTILCIIHQLCVTLETKIMKQFKCYVNIVKFVIVKCGETRSQLLARVLYRKRRTSVRSLLNRRGREIGATIYGEFRCLVMQNKNRIFRGKCYFYRNLYAWYIYIARNYF